MRQTLTNLTDEDREKFDQYFQVAEIVFEVQIEHYVNPQPEYTVEFERRDEELQKKCDKYTEYFDIKFETEKRIADAREIIKKMGKRSIEISRRNATYNVSHITYIH